MESTRPWHSSRLRRDWWLAPGLVDPCGCRVWLVTTLARPTGQLTKVSLFLFWSTICRRDRREPARWLQAPRHRLCLDLSYNKYLDRHDQHRRRQYAQWCLTLGLWHHCHFSASSYCRRAHYMRGAPTGWTLQTARQLGQNYHHSIGYQHHTCSRPSTAKSARNRRQLCSAKSVSMGILCLYH